MNAKLSQQRTSINKLTGYLEPGYASAPSQKAIEEANVQKTLAVMSAAIGTTQHLCTKAKLRPKELTPTAPHCAEEGKAEFPVAK